MAKVTKANSKKVREAGSASIETQIDRPSTKVNGSMINILDHYDTL